MERQFGKRVASSQYYQPSDYANIGAGTLYQDQNLIAKVPVGGGQLSHVNDL